MSAANMTYAAMAGKVGVRRCRGVNPLTGQTCYVDHKVGEFSDGLLHWGERLRVTKPGQRRFLLIAAQSEPSVAAAQPRWRVIYLANRWVSTTAARIGLRLPEGLADLDRAMVRAFIANVPLGEPQRAEALKWSQR